MRDDDALDWTVGLCRRAVKTPSTHTHARVSITPIPTPNCAHSTTGTQLPTKPHPQDHTHNTARTTPPTRPHTTPPHATQHPRYHTHDITPTTLRSLTWRDRLETRLGKFWEISASSARGSDACMMRWLACRPTSFKSHTCRQTCQSKLRKRLPSRPGSTRAKESC